MADVALFVDDAQAQKWLKRLQKKIRDVKDGARKFGDLLSAKVFADVIQHFESQEGSKGPWKAWSDTYAEHMRKIGKGGNRILQDTGRLRQSFTPASHRAVSQGILWYNQAKTAEGFPYAYAHQEGGKRLPKRDFMWLSTDAQGAIEQLTLQFVLEEG